MNEGRWTRLGIAAVLGAAVWLAAGLSPVSAQTKRDGDKAEKESKGLTLKEAHRLALENSYDLLQVKKQLAEKKITRSQYEARVARLAADVERAYMGLYVARLDLQVATQRSARRSSGKSVAKPASGKEEVQFPTSPDVAQQDKSLAQARELAAFIPLENQVKLQELNLKALLNSKTYPIRSDAEVVPTDRPVAMKKDLDAESLIEKALNYADQQSGSAAARGRSARPDRTPADVEQDKKRIILGVKRAVLKAMASVKRLEIARQVREAQEKRLDLLRSAKANPAEIQAASDAVDEAAVDELKAIVAHNGDLMDIGDLTGTLQKDLDVQAGD